MSTVILLTIHFSVPETVLDYICCPNILSDLSRIPDVFIFNGLLLVSFWNKISKDKLVRPLLWTVRLTTAVIVNSMYKPIIIYLTNCNFIYFVRNPFGRIDCVSWKINKFLFFKKVDGEYLADTNMMNLSSSVDAGGELWWTGLRKSRRHCFEKRHQKLRQMLLDVG